MSDQETKPTEAVGAPVADTPVKDTPVEGTAVKLPDAETETTKADEPIKPETATEEAQNAQSDEGAEAEEPKKAVRSLFNPPEGMLRTTRRRPDNQDNHNNNIKFDPSTLPETDDPQMIRTQVEFYFGDSNLPNDKHLWEKVGGEENKAVSLSDICSFKRMHRFKPYTAVVSALKDSKFLIIEGEEGKETVRRKHPYDASKQESIIERSIYVKGFGDEEPSTQFDIEAFFTQFGAINSVRLRREKAKDDKRFKGSVFVEWADKETAKKFLALRPEPKWKGHPLYIMSKQVYVSLKNEEIREGIRDPQGNKKSWGGQQRGGRGGRGGRGRGNHHGDSNDWKKRRENDQKNGYENRRGGRHNRGRGRGGRGRGRGRGGRDHSENDRATQEEPVDDRQVGRPKIHTSSEGAKIKEEMNGSSSKRARDEDGAAEAERPAKKVDQKEGASEAT